MLPCSCSVTRRSWDCRGRRRWQVSTYVYHRYMASPMPAIPLRLDSVVKRFGDLTAVSGVSLEVRERACLGLLGLVWLRRGRSGHHLRTCTLQAELPLESTAAAPLCRPSRGRWRLVSAVRLPARPPAYRQASITGRPQLHQHAVDCRVLRGHAQLPRPLGFIGDGLKTEVAGEALLFLANPLLRHGLPIHQVWHSLLARIYEDHNPARKVGDHNVRPSRGGRLPGGAVTIITRGGAHQFHGSAYEFVKNQLFNANDYFSNLYKVKKGVFHNNIFGGAVGGPVRIPWIYNGHNKSFFFLSYEGNRQNSTSNLATASVPTEAERTGDFSNSTVSYNGQIIPAKIYDPTTGVIQPDGTIHRQQFAYNGVLNVIPSNRLDAIAKAYSAFYPLPNKAAVGTNHENNYVGTAINESRNNRWTGRFDQIWSPRNSSYFTITAYDDFNGSPAWFGPMGDSKSGTQVAKAAALHHVLNLSPTTILEGYVGVVRDTGPNDGSLGQVGYNSISSSVDYTKFGFGSAVGAILGSGTGKAPDIYTQNDVSDLGGGGGALTYETDFH